MRHCTCNWACACLQDLDAPDVGFAADHQFLLELDNATLGSEFAQQRYSKQWLKAEDIRYADGSVQQALICLFIRSQGVS